MHTYVAVYRNKRKEIMASSLYGAKVAAVEYFKPSKRNESEVGVYLVETDAGQKVNVVPQTF
jgi:hypothetical protein